MRAKLINEKFIEDSDPIDDLIGERSNIDILNKKIIRQIKELGYELKRNREGWLNHSKNIKGGLLQITVSTVFDLFHMTVDPDIDNPPTDENKLSFTVEWEYPKRFLDKFRKKSIKIFDDTIDFRKNGKRMTDNKVLQKVIDIVKEWENQVLKESLNEKFKEESDPIRDLKIGMKFPEHFEPKYILIKQYPGMTWPINSFFGEKPGWRILAAWHPMYNNGKESYFTDWSPEFFEPWVGEFFEEY
jgi:hypothetical protein